MFPEDIRVESCSAAPGAIGSSRPAMLSSNALRGGVLIKFLEKAAHYIKFLGLPF